MIIGVNIDLVDMNIISIIIREKTKINYVNELAQTQIIQEIDYRPVIRQ